MSLGVVHRFDRVGRWLGITAPVLMVLGFFAIDEGGTELPDGSITDIVGHIDLNHGRMVVGTMVGMVGAVLLVGFVVSLRMRLAREGREGELLALMAYAFGLIMAIGGFVQGSFRLATRAVVDPDVPAEAMLPLWRLGHVSDLLFWGALGLVATMSASAFRIRLLPKPIAWVGVVLTSAGVVLIPTDHGGVGIGLLMWLVVACALPAGRVGPANSRADA